MGVKNPSKYSPSFHTDRHPRPLCTGMPCPGFVNSEGFARILWENIQPGRETQGSGLGCRPEGHPRTGNAGIRAWQGSGEACQDRNRGKTVLAAARKGTPGPEMREYGLGCRPEGHPRTGNAGIRAWVGAKTADQDQNHRKLGLANTGCPRNYPGFRKLWVSLLFMTEVPILLCQKMSIQSYLLHRSPCCDLRPNTNRRLNHLRNFNSAL